MINLSNNPTQQNTLPSNGYTRIMPLADILNIHHQTLRRWIKQNKIPAPKVVNGVKLFSNAEILDWLETGEVTPSTATEGA